MVANVVAGIVTAVLVAAAGWLWHERRLVRIALWALIHRRSDVRVSISALLLTRSGQSYLLLPNRSRTAATTSGSSTLAPLGGVRKVYVGRESEMVTSGFGFQAVRGDPDKETGQDLRGTIRAPQLLRLLHTIRDGSSVESPGDALRRELVEELNGDGDLVRSIYRVPLKHVRTGYEGPCYFEGKRLWQLRITDVLEIVGDRSSPHVAEVDKAIAARCETVSSDEIELGERRDHSARISSPSVFLVRARASSRPDPPL